MFIIRSEEEKAVVEQNHFMSKMKALVCQFSTCVDIKHSTCSYKLKSKMYTFFSHPSEISYKASFCSKIGVFYWVTTILTFIPPLLIAYRSQGKPHFSGRFQIPKKISSSFFRFLAKNWFVWGAARYSFRAWPHCLIGNQRSRWNHWLEHNV